MRTSSSNRFSMQLTENYVHHKSSREYFDGWNELVAVCHHVVSDSGNSFFVMDFGNVQNLKKVFKKCQERRNNSKKIFCKPTRNFYAKKIRNIYVSIHCEVIKIFYSSLNRKYNQILKHTWLILLLIFFASTWTFKSHKNYLKRLLKLAWQYFCQHSHEAQGRSSNWPSTT